jgi:hypothetical protein
VNYRLGVTEVCFGDMPRVEAAETARDLGFSHIDVAGDDEAELALPVVDRSWHRPRAGFSCGAPPDGPGVWERAVNAYRKIPGSRIEAWPGSIISTVEQVVAFFKEVPESTLLLDTGHVATWGEDPAELIPYAEHVQLRQARKGVPQTYDGDVDMKGFIESLRKAGYQGSLSIEYLDIPEMGFALDDPLAHTIALAEKVRPLL